MFLNGPGFCKCHYLLVQELKSTLYEARLQFPSCTVLPKIIIQGLHFIWHFIPINLLKCICCPHQYITRGAMHQTVRAITVVSRFRLASNEASKANMNIHMIKVSAVRDNSHNQYPKASLYFPLLTP